ncbi:unnamed protein product [Prorocentrum cordatum]|uniref:Uncharacterized protein n=1 Tax=Prorocentrum cordatum TaxID=2364126 RepID=A0ABN9YAX4_9DINO|nr:unnamed protein product [Polarella glacialis]
MRHELLHGGMPRRRLWRRPTSKARPPGARGCARRGGKRSGRDFRGGELGWGRRGGPGGEAEAEGPGVSRGREGGQRAATAGRGGGGRARTGSWSSVGLLCARTADRLACLASLAWPADGQRTPGGSDGWGKNRGSELNGSEDGEGKQKGASGRGSRLLKRAASGSASWKIAAWFGGRWRKGERPRGNQEDGMRTRRTDGGDVGNPNVLCALRGDYGPKLPQCGTAGADPMGAFAPGARTTLADEEDKGTLEEEQEEEEEEEKEQEEEAAQQ